MLNQFFIRLISIKVRAIRFTRCTFSSTSCSVFNSFLKIHSFTLKEIMFHSCTFLNSFFQFLNFKTLDQLEKFELTSSDLNYFDFYAFFIFLPNSLIFLNLNLNAEWMKRFLYCNFSLFQQPVNLKQFRFQWHCTFDKKHLIAFLSKFDASVEIEMIGNNLFLMQHLKQDLEEAVGKRKLKLIEFPLQKLQKEELYEQKPLLQ